MSNTIYKLVFTGVIGLSSQLAIAASPLQLSSDVFVERQQKRADGSVATVLEKPKLVVPGDNLVFVVKYKNVGSTPANNFSVTNPLPNAVAFNGTSDGREIVSVDGGKNWGALGALQVKASDGKLRSALMTDVTHIKWNLNKSLSVGSEGRLMFRGVVK
jgi:uncharacterized repeat protein (TIGR01451 family)